ncbi:hypothetical protein [Halapricum salinum]|uniref:hypothetical protein n=1 Tax=Halapricum salinum TaxID=1457250 RepID=UPI001F18B2AA|nr:hypothetical protein [Halapricum salinum]
MSAGKRGRLYTANIVDTVIFRSLGKYPNHHLDRLKDAVEESQTEIWVPELVYDELADHGPNGTVTNPYLDHGIEDGWIRLVSPPFPEEESVGDEHTPRSASKAWQEANHFLDQHSKYPTTNNHRDSAMVASAVHLFDQNKRIRIITHTADELLAKACTVIPPEFGYYEVSSRYYHPPRDAKETFPTVDSLTWDE